MEVKARHYLGVIGQDFKSIPQQLNNTYLHCLCLRGVVTLLVVISFVYYWQIPFPFWAVISAFVSIHPDMGAQVKKFFERCTAAVIGCWLGYLLAAFIVNLPVLWTNVIIFGTAVTFSYLASQAYYFSYFWMYTGLHVPLIMLLAANSPQDEVLNITAYRPFDIFIGAFTCIPLAYIMFYESTTVKYQTLFDKWTGDLQQWSNQLINQLQSQSYDFESALEQYIALRQQGQNLKKQLLVAAFQNWSWFFYLKRWRREIDVVSNVIERLWNFYRLQLRLKQGHVSYEQAQQLQQFMSHYITIITSRIGHKDVKLTQGDYTRYLKDLDTIQPGSPLQMLIPKMRANWDKLMQVQAHQTISLPHESQHRLTWQPAHMKHAIKQSLSLLIVAWVTVLLRIPGGTLNMALAIITVMQLDVFSTYHRGAQRFLGCILGIALGGFIILVIEPATLWGLMIWVSAIAYCLYFLTFAWKGAQYLAIQAGVAFFVTTIGPQISLSSFTSGVERAVGIMVGVTVAWGVNRLLWPDSYQQRLVNAIDNMAEQLSQLAQNTQQWLKHRDTTILNTPIMNYPSLHELLSQPSVQEGITDHFRTQLLLRARITSEIHYCLPYCIRLLHHNMQLHDKWLVWFRQLAQTLTHIDDDEHRDSLSIQLRQQLPTSGQQHDDKHLQDMADHLISLIEAIPTRSYLISIMDELTDTTQADFRY